MTARFGMNSGINTRMAKVCSWPIAALNDLHALIDWARIEGMLACIHANKKGEHAWPLLLMFKAMLLQSWLNLSDPKLEEQLARDLLFRRFVGLGFADSLTNHSTLWLFATIQALSNYRAPF